MTILNFKPFFTIYMAVLAIALLMNTRIVIASTIEPEKLPVQTEIAINSEKDIPRLEWTAGILLRQGQIDEAEIQYKRLLTRKNISTNIFLNANFSLCRIGLEKKDFDDVIKRAKTLTDLYSPIPQSYKFLADAYMGKNEYENAVNTYKKLIAQCR